MAGDGREIEAMRGEVGDGSELVALWLCPVSSKLATVEVEVLEDPGQQRLNEAELLLLVLLLLRLLLLLLLL